MIISGCLNLAFSDWILIQFSLINFESVEEVSRSYLNFYLKIFLCSFLSLVIN